VRLVHLGGNNVLVSRPVCSPCYGQKCRLEPGA